MFSSFGLEPSILEGFSVDQFSVICVINEILFFMRKKKKKMNTHNDRGNVYKLGQLVNWQKN